MVINPNSLRSWLRFLDYRKSNADAAEVIVLYERALLQLPWSYKLWFEYINYRISLTECLGDGRPLEALALLFERALLFLGKCPGIWESYMRFVIRFKKFSLVRKLLNRALRSLPVTQHMRFWKLWLSLNPPALISMRILRRYIQVCCVITYLISFA